MIDGNRPVTCGCTGIDTAGKLLDHMAGRDNKCDWTYELAAAILDNEPRPPAVWEGYRVVSVSDLVASCQRKSVLTKAHQPVVHLDDLYAAWHGTAVHGALDRHQAPGSAAEVRLVASHPTRPDVVITGKPDLVDYQHGWIVDYKTASLLGKEPFRAYRSWVEQLQLYRWLWDNAERELTYDADHDRWEAVGRRHRSPDEWQGTAILRLTREHHIQQLVPREGRGWRSDPPVLWSDDQAEEFIEERSKNLLDTFPPEAPDGWRERIDTDKGPVFVPVGKLCGFCPVRKECATQP